MHAVHSYLINFLLDSTVGLLIIYLLLTIVRCIVYCNGVTALRSGEYGEREKKTLHKANNNIWSLAIFRAFL